MLETDLSFLAPKSKVHLTSVTNCGVERAGTIMKKFVRAVGFIALITSSISYADGISSLPLLISCTGQTVNGDPIEVSIVGAPSNPQIQLIINSAQIALLNVSVKSYPGQTYYESTRYMNPNQAPTSLMLQTYTDNGRLLGEFTEVSYLPILAKSGGLVCQTNTTAAF
jgi:hypothetical protein